MLLRRVFKTVHSAESALRAAKFASKRFKYSIVRCIATIDGEVDKHAYVPGVLYVWRLQRARHAGLFRYPVAKKDVLDAERVTRRGRAPKLPLEELARWRAGDDRREKARQRMARHGVLMLTRKERAEKKKLEREMLQELQRDD